MRQEGFRLNRAPLMRLDLIRTADDRHEFVWSFHHLLLDGWSVFRVLQDVFTTYEALVSGKDIELPPQRPYRDFIAHLKRQDLAPADAYWKRALDGFTSPTPLPLNRGLSYERLSADVTGAEELRLSESVSASLQDLARRHRVTLNSVVQLAWGVLLSRYSRSSDVVFGAVSAGRPPELDDVESMVGLFINTLPVRVTLSPDECCLDALERLQRQQVESRQFEHSPLVRIQQCSSIPSDRQLFDTLLMFENYRKELSIEEMAESLRIENVRWFERATYALTLIAIPEDEFLLRILYDCGKFDRDSIRRMLGHLQTLLAGIADRPEQTLDDLTLVTPAERRQLLVDWNATATSYPKDKTIQQVFEEQVERDPDATALVLDDGSLTYGLLNERANQLGHYLRSLGIGAGTPVAICCERSFAMIVGLLGILKAGGAYVPLDASYPDTRLQLMLEDVRAPVVLTQQRFRDRLPECDAQVVCLDEPPAQIAPQSRENPACLASPEELAYVMYTSGSTGRPKGVQIPHRGVVRLVKDTNYARFGADETFLQFSTLSFDASTFEIWGALLNGARLVLFPPREASLEDLSQVIREAGVTTLWLTAGLFHEMVDRNVEGLRGVRQLLAGGDVLSGSHVRRALETLEGCTVINGYGPTENTTFTCCYPMPDPDQLAESVPIGRPIANTRAYVLDKLMRPVPIGVPGELYVGGDGLARAYLNQPGLTDEKFVPSPFGELPDERLYRTGDLCRYLPDGRLEFIGREDGQVKIRGFRIELGEIEAALGTHPEVRQTLVLAREDRPGDKQLVAYVVPRDGASLSVGSVREYLGNRLPAYMLPQALVPLDEFPLTLNGKVDRKRLPTPQTASHGSAARVIAPRTELERTIADAWRDVLQVDEVGVDDNFFDLGGHSLHVMKIFSRLRAVLPEELSIVDLFQYPTVRGLACHMSENQADELSLQDARQRAEKQRRSRQRRLKRRAPTTNE
jgi:amino acid adenylation domain-containing protein